MHLPLSAFWIALSFFFINSFRGFCLFFHNWICFYCYQGYSQGKSTVKINSSVNKSTIIDIWEVNTPNQICIFALASDLAVLYGNDAFSILVLSTEKQYCSFLKTFKISTDYNVKINMRISQTEGYFENP